MGTILMKKNSAQETTETRPAINGRPEGKTQHTFVLGTGRCGSTTIARVLEHCDGVECYNEPEPILIREARMFLKCEISCAEIVDVLRRTLRRVQPEAVVSD